jgi:hypothetical protein
LGWETPGHMLNHPLARPTVLAMLTPVTYLAVAQGPLSEPDWASLGLVSAIVGCFLIANAILFEHPRRLVRQYFGRQTGRLRSVREYVYNRVQTTLGFTFLLGGFGLQLIGRTAAPEAAVAGGPPLSMVWVGILVLVAVSLLFTGWWWSLWAFRRYVREYFLETTPTLDGDPAMVRELGELFGVESRTNDTVESYTNRLRERVGLEPIGDRDRGRRSTVLPQVAPLDGARGAGEAV